MVTVPPKVQMIEGTSIYPAKSPLKSIVNNITAIPPAKPINDDISK